MLFLLTESQQQQQQQLLSIMDNFCFLDFFLNSQSNLIFI